MIIIFLLTFKSIEVTLQTLNKENYDIKTINNNMIRN